MAREATFDEVLRTAVDDISEHGYDSAERLMHWQEELRKAAERSTTPTAVMERLLREAMVAIYKREIEKGGALRRHKGLSRFTIDQMAPRLHSVLQRKIFASADLIRLNKKEAVDLTIKRLSGWASSVPEGGSEAIDKRETKDDIKKSLAGIKFRERRVIIDQGHKLVSSINETLAEDGGAIAGRWKSQWRRAGYDYREDHKERDGLIFVVPDNWALKAGLMKLAGRPYTNDVTKPAEEPFCSCAYEYIFTLGALPDDMLTAKGREQLAKARLQMRK